MRGSTVIAIHVHVANKGRRTLIIICFNTVVIQSLFYAVVKFKRRPQYLEYFVHLASAALSQWKGDMILDWSCDVFAWIKK